MPNQSLVLSYQEAVFPHAILSTSNQIETIKRLHACIFVVETSDCQVKISGARWQHLEVVDALQNNAPLVFVSCVLGFPFWNQSTEQSSVFMLTVIGIWKLVAIHNLIPLCYIYTQVLF